MAFNPTSILGTSDANLGEFLLAGVAGGVPPPPPPNPPTHTDDYEAAGLIHHHARRRTAHQAAALAQSQGIIKIIVVPFPGTREFELPMGHWAARRDAYARAGQGFRGDQASVPKLIVADPPARIAHQAAEPVRLQPVHYRLWQPPQVIQPPLPAGAQVISVPSIASAFAAGVPILKGGTQTIFPTGISAGAVGTPGLAGGDTSFQVIWNGVAVIWVQRLSVKVSRQLSGRATCNFTMEVNTGAFVPNPDDQVIINEGGVRWFAGTVDTVDAILHPMTAANFEYSVSCVDKNIVCDRRFVFQDYGVVPAPGLSPIIIERDMILDVVAKFLSGEGITTNNVDGFAAILQNLVYHGKPVTQVFDDIASCTGDQWFIDFFNDLHFKNKLSAPSFTATPNGYTLATNNLRYRNLKVKRTRSKYRNVQYVRSDQYLVQTTRKETFTAVGGPAAFPTVFPIKYQPTVKVNGVDVGTVNELFSVPGAALLGWYWIKNSGGVFNNATPPGAGASVEVSYNSFSSNIICVQDNVQIAARAAAGGGSGRFEALEEVTGADTADATFIATGLLRQYGAAGFPILITYQNDYPPPEPGMLVDVNIPELGAVGSFLVQQTSSQDMGSPLAQGVSFRSDITLVSTEDQGSGITWFEDMLARTAQGDPTISYFKATFILGPGGGLTTGNNGANPYIIQANCELAEVKLAAGTAPATDLFRCDILRAIGGTGVASTIFATGKYAEIPMGSTDLIKYTADQLAKGPLPLQLLKDDVLTPNVLLANGSSITLELIFAVRGKGVLG